MLRSTQGLVWHSSKALPSAPWASHFDFSWKFTVMLSASVTVRRVAGQGQATVCTVPTRLEKENSACILHALLSSLLHPHPMLGPPSHTSHAVLSHHSYIPHAVFSPPSHTPMPYWVLPPVSPEHTGSSLYPCTHSDTSLSLMQPHQHPTFSRSPCPEASLKPMQMLGKHGSPLASQHVGGRAEKSLKQVD